MPTGSDRVSFGMIAAVLSVLIFHQGMWELLHFLRLMPPSYPIDPVGWFGIPRIYDICLWSALWGAAFGLLERRMSRVCPMWALGLALGCLSALDALFVVPAIKGLPLAGGWEELAFIRAFLIHGFWGLGVGLIFPLLVRLTDPRRTPAWDR
jgi:hypothetical protein